MEDWEREVYEFAKQGYGKQKDDEGKSYFDTHIIQVVGILKQVTDDKDLIRAAYLHDLIEDTNIDYDYIKQFFGQRVADLVNEVTHEGNDDIGHWFPRLKTKDGILLKYADRLSNLSRMNAWDEERQQHYLKKSKFWYSDLKEKPNSDNVVIELNKKEAQEIMKKGKELNKNAMEIRADIKRLFKL